MIRNPDLFDKYLSDYFHKQDPLVVNVVDNPKILYPLLKFYGKNDSKFLMQIERFFYSPTREDEIPHMKGLDDILMISWEQILRDVNSRMPFIYRIPIFGFFLKLLSGFGKYMDKAVENQLIEKKKQPKLSQILAAKKVKKPKKTEVKKNVPDIRQEKEKQKARIIREQMYSLQQKIIGNKDLDEMLTYFESKWNHTINPDARQENINLVKTKIQHRLGFIKQVTADVIRRETMDMLRTESTFKKVADIDSLKKYISLYMTKYYLTKQ
jgi:hypothetical protein